MRPILYLTVLLVFALSATAGDWPQILGPERNGKYMGKDLAESWPKDGPPVVWQRTVGQGFSGLAIAGGKLILFHRVDNKEVVECLDAVTGQPLWKYEYPTEYRNNFGQDEGPRAVPTITDGKVFTFGADGVISALDFSKGTKLWSHDTRKEFGAGRGFFGLVCSPLVEGNAVMLNVGGDGAGIVAFHKDTGELLWKSTTDNAGYSSPIMATIEGERLALFLTADGFVAIEPGNGKVRYQLPWRAPIRESVNAADPVFADGLIFISASYHAGAVALRPEGRELKKLWSGDGILSCHYSTSVYRDGMLYGFDGRHDYPPGAEVRCVELSTGKVRWSKPGLHPANLMLAGDDLLILTESGQLVRAAASPEGYQEKSQAQVLGSGVRAFPALANGLFYARDTRKLICIDLRKGK